MIRSRILPSLALLLSGCAGAPGNYPSLAKRAVEGAPTASPSAPAVPAPADSALAAELARLTAQAQSGRDAFDGRYAGAERLARAASGSVISSEAWVSAQQAVSALESARNDSVSALASLDVLYVDRLSAIAEGRASGGAAEIDSARAAALAIVDSQNDRIDALKARLAQP
ncbi:hypothetical protein GGR44_000923 [Sphingobium fontiphilum]|uniref:DUF4398 domain-containing protein n=1 Tax=Sphingobium fontiphilum TaxID=944425 RepID=A0A7W6DDJ9_9SPHN|nr:hypothetical protein [Sphingobium fontiphilum]MBB3981276.1 hypothetical protein [Sphingobium fontiphilum]